MTLWMMGMRVRRGGVREERGVQDGPRARRPPCPRLPLPSTHRLLHHSPRILPLAIFRTSPTSTIMTPASISSFLRPLLLPPPINVFHPRNSPPFLRPPIAGSFSPSNPSLLPPTCPPLSLSLDPFMFLSLAHSLLYLSLSTSVFHMVYMPILRSFLALSLSLSISMSSLPPNNTSLIVYPSLALLVDSQKLK